MSREIGSEFWDVPVAEQSNSLFPNTTQWYLSGRSALNSIIKECLKKGCSDVAMPSWCCDSMIKPFTEAGIKVKFYPVYWNDKLVKKVDFDSDILFLMDYFGYTDSENIELEDYKGIVIRDLTHSLFSSAYSDAGFYFGSLRKWCGVWTGGYAWTDDNHKLLFEKSNESDYITLRQKAMQLKTAYISGNDVKDNGYLQTFDEAESILENIGIAPAAERDINLAKQLDVKKLFLQRRENAEILRKELKKQLIFADMKDTDCPMFVPILVPDGKRDALRRYLINNNIYCPVHWPVSEYHILTEKEKYIYDNELSLVCDQRYTSDDMNRIVETIRQFWKET